MKVNLHTPIEEVQIQIIPLIDVIFCILTFFILATLQFTRQQAINVDLPKANTGTVSGAISQGGRQILPVTIDAIGQIYTEKQPIKREQLRPILEDYIKKNPDGVLVLNASRSATYNDVLETLDLLRQVGGDRVSLGIIPGSSEQPNFPNFPNNSAPGAPPLPNTAPVSPINPQGNPNFNSPPVAPGLPQNGQNLPPLNPGTNPVFPTAPGSPAPVAPNR